MHSATLVDSDDRIEQLNSQQNQENEEDISKLLLMKRLLNARSQARALASSTFSSQRASFSSKNVQIDAADLHTAYRLPLHRLSDSQLSILLHKYADPTEVNEQVNYFVTILK